MRYDMSELRGTFHMVTIVQKTVGPVCETALTVLRVTSSLVFMDLYHADIRLPDGFVAPTARVRLRWTRHADVARSNDRYGEIPRFQTATLGRLKVIEVGVENNKVVKILFRGRLDDTRDVCMVLMPVRDFWLVKTVWCNVSDDGHQTLDTSRYVR